MEMKQSIPVCTNTCDLPSISESYYKQFSWFIPSNTQLTLTYSMLVWAHFEPLPWLLWLTQSNPDCIENTLIVLLPLLC